MKSWQVVVVVVVVIVGAVADILYVRSKTENAVNQVRAVSSENTALVNQHLQAIEKSLSGSVTAAVSNVMQASNARVNQLGDTLTAEINSTSSNTTLAILQRFQTLERSLNARLESLAASRGVVLPASHRYQLIKGERTWHQAKVDAEARGGHLATITSEAEWTEIKRQVPEISGTVSPSSVFWIGATDEGGSWKWVTGEEWKWTFWLPGEPSSYPDEHPGYVAITCTYSPAGQWNNAPKAGVYPYYLLETE